MLKNIYYEFLSLENIPYIKIQNGSYPKRSKRYVFKDMFLSRTAIQRAI